ncbi:nucleotidyltransferase substrate binding protein [Siccirubricoccus phaeus]|uniref:nucleotidyltransferase substrate binding protein n=1 Tax=Siccirubricoccus phaeus TaxID=2595053 RepID=UPI0011F3340C|nr:nucleotidyltransferase substrate binding protein [Siccirubricoccus phaeus]
MSGEAVAALRERLGQVAQALDRFGAALARDPASDDLLVDATIQRFEFSIELFWSAAQAALRREGIEARSPRAAQSA